MYWLEIVAPRGEPGDTVKAILKEEAVWDKKSEVWVYVVIFDPIWPPPLG